jgi:hypothetical protein
MTRRTPHRIGVYLALVQFIFTLTWTVYVIFLPKLAAQAGIPKHYVVYILLLDQLIFVIADYSMGLMADRASRVLGRLGHIILGVTLASCLAFLLLPFAAPQGAAWLFLSITVLWTISSSALRAPPLTLIGKYAAQPCVPWLSALSLFGLGLAGAASPYLAITLRDLDPRLPFVISSVALALATLGIMWAERTLAKTSAATPAAAPTAAKPGAPVVWFLAAILLVGIGFQIHFSLNAAPLFLRHATPDQLQYLMPVFWIGFNLLMLPASLATKRWGGIAVASVGAIVAALAAFLARTAGDLDTLLALQFIAGGGWGCVLMSAFSAAIAIGHTGREGKLTGGLFSLLAVAAFARIAFLAAELNKDPAFAAALSWIPVVTWGAGGVILFCLALTRSAEGAPVRA